MHIKTWYEIIILIEYKVETFLHYKIIQIIDLLEKLYIIQIFIKDNFLPFFSLNAIEQR